MKMKKRYMYYCSECKHLSFQKLHCEECGNKNMICTPRKYGLSNVSCISKSVLEFEKMKQEFLERV